MVKIFSLDLQGMIDDWHVGYGGGIILSENSKIVTVKIRGPTRFVYYEQFW